MGQIVESQVARGAGVQRHERVSENASNVPMNGGPEVWDEPKVPQDLRFKLSC